MEFLLIKSSFAALYTLLKKEDLLSNLNRMRVYQVISDFPEIQYHDIISKTKLSKGTLTYHLWVLERENIIKSHPDGRLRRYNLHPDQEKKSAEEILTDISRVDEVMRTKILKLIKRKDGITQKEICKILGVSKQVASYHIINLESDELIRTEKHGLTKKCYIRKD